MLFNQYGQPYTALVTPQAPQARPVVTTAPYPTGRITGSMVITVVAQANPKLPGSNAAARWALYANGQTVAAFVALAKANGHSHPASDVRYNVAHGYITVA